VLRQSALCGTRAFREAKSLTSSFYLLRALSVVALWEVLSQPNPLSNLLSPTLSKKIKKEGR